MDWREFVETLSSVEQTLRDDPSGIYAQMDFGTRDRYRHAVESIAKLGARSETEVARLAVQLAAGAARRTAPTARPTARHQHVGYYLIGDGRAALEEAAGVRAGRRARARAPGPAPPAARSTPARSSSITLALVAGPLLDVAPARRLALVGRGAVRHRAAAGDQPARGLAGQLAGRRCSSSRSRCRGWTIRTASRPSRARWSSCRRCSATPPASRRWSMRSRCASSPTATRTCTSRC